LKNPLNPDHGSHCDPRNNNERMKERMVILGGGESGVGAALLAAQRGYDVFVSDGGPLKAEYRQTLSTHQIAF
jgi:UDP-N-acetylmuramoylalanine--D-glutamate ligase